MKFLEILRLVLANKDLIMEIVEFIRSLQSGGAVAMNEEKYPAMAAMAADEGLTLADAHAEVAEAE